jgi:superfamily II DNA or RNA helicase
MSREILLVKTGNILLVDSRDTAVIELLKPILTFTSYRNLVGQELYLAKRQDRKTFVIDKHELFQFDHLGRLATPYGFWFSIRNQLKAAGYTVKCKNMSPDDPKTFKLYRQNIADYKLRPHQPEFLEAVIKHSCGRIDCAPGFGKSFMIGIIASVFPKAKIDVVSRRVAVLRDRIYPELAAMVGDVGIVGGGKTLKNRRVMCYTAGSLKHSPANCDILIGDECHELAADNASAELVRWQRSRNYGLSASHDARFDNKDRRLEGIFGPIIYRVPYSTAQESGLVVPINIKWTYVNMDYNPCAGLDDNDAVRRKRIGIWHNDYRNTLIQEDARSYDENTQVLIVVDTITHAFHLKQKLPEFTLVYADDGITEQELASYKKQGLCGKNEQILTADRKKLLTTQFEKGTLKKVIATTVWNVGVSFNHLSVLVRAGGGGSAINDTQIPGRVSRIADGKVSGVVHDYLDEFDRVVKRQSKQRVKVYASHGWTQSFPTEAIKEEYS